jgi:hypothetical protein
MCLSGGVNYQQSYVASVARENPDDAVMRARRTRQPGKGRLRVGLVSNCQRAALRLAQDEGARVAGTVDSGLPPAKRRLCYRAGQVGVRPLCSSVTRQGGWLGNYSEGRIGLGVIIRIGGRMSMMTSETLFMCRKSLAERRIGPQMPQMAAEYECGIAEWGIGE